ncbi:MAG: hypothetical protein IJN54_02535 [Lachnospiraceae bacterium]|nr:hypothetical protein [Lachnospiraceae bacterium]
MPIKTGKIYDYRSHRTKNYTSKLFGENTYIFSPDDTPAEVNQILDEIWSRQEAAQFGKERFQFISCRERMISLLPSRWDFIRR